MRIRGNENGKIAFLSSVKINHLLRSSCNYNHKQKFAFAEMDLDGTTDILCCFYDKSHKSYRRAKCCWYSVGWKLGMFELRNTCTSCSVSASSPQSGEKQGWIHNRSQCWITDVLTIITLRSMWWTGYTKTKCFNIEGLSSKWNSKTMNIIL